MFKDKLIDGLIFIRETVVSILDFVANMGTGFIFGMSYVLWHENNPEGPAVFLFGLFFALHDAWKLYRDDKKKIKKV